MGEIKEGSRVIVKSHPIQEIVGLTGTVESVNPNYLKYVKNMVRFDVPLEPSGVEFYWFCDDDLKVIEE